MAALDERKTLELAKTTLLALVWSGIEKIFGELDVRITAAPTLQSLGSKRAPMALIRPGTGTADLDEPALMEIGFSVTVIWFSGGDEIGEAALLGSHANADRGLLDLGRRIVLALRALKRDDGAQIVAVSRGPAQSAYDETTGMIVYRDYNFLTRVGVET